MDRARADEAIIAHLLKAIERTSPLSIGAFLGFDGEPDLRPLLEQLHGANLRLALPVIHPTRPGIMSMHEWTPATPLQLNRDGIDEPRGTPLIQATDLDWALLPLAAFDADGTRLGLGGGFYDRWLKDGRPRQPLRLGVAYACQQLNSLPRETWDLPLDGVVTEHGRISFSS